MVVRCAAEIQQFYCSMTQQMRFRTLTPEDFAVLKLVDEAFSYNNSLPKTFVAQLPRVKASRCSDHECSICLSEFEENERVTRLPCNHHFCTICITTWLTENGNHCPQCRAVVHHPDEAESMEADEVDMEVSDCPSDRIALLRPNCSTVTGSGGLGYFQVGPAVTEAGGLGNSQISKWRSRLLQCLE